MVLIQSWPPHLALAPIAQIDPPLMPFRDAGYSQADYGITVQDVVYGVWKAKEESCCVLDNFDLDEYERSVSSCHQHDPILNIVEGSTYERWTAVLCRPVTFLRRHVADSAFLSGIDHTISQTESDKPILVVLSGLTGGTLQR